MDFYKFYTGQEFNAYEYLGAHVVEKGVVFRTFAPNAKGICLLGEFSDWQDIPMNKVEDGNFWEVWVENAEAGQMYKYKIFGADGSVEDHADPYGYEMQLRPDSASIIWDLRNNSFTDEEWMKQRSDEKHGPLNIYELHFGSWKKKFAAKKKAGNTDDESEQMEDYGEWYRYEELAPVLLPYLKEKGYNYIEVMPLNEHPCDESWGYQGTGFFSPTSRYGTPDGLRQFINACHMEGIGVILDFVPVHFALDDYALKRYDGTELYEYPHQDVGTNEWGSCNFMHSRGEVRSFLQSSAQYWIEQYHFDGLRMDAISNMIYWQGDPARGTNQGAIEFLRTMNGELKRKYPSLILAAEDSTNFPNVTASVADGGLGFDYKWDMGWMNDTLSYFQADTEERKNKYHKLTFSMQYYYDANYLLPLSHDEVVHGKATIVQKMNGDYENKFIQARAFYMYMYAHPGKKLNFMGNELGQLREWDEKREQDWMLLEYPIHQQFSLFMKELCNLYEKMPALYEMDYDRAGFEWIDCHQENKCIYVIERRSFDAKQRIAAVFNFSSYEEEYQLHVSGCQKLKPIMNSNWKEFGGTEAKSKRAVAVNDGQVTLQLPAFSARYYEIL